MSQKTKTVDGTFRLPGERKSAASPEVNCGFDPDLRPAKTEKPQPKEKTAKIEAAA